MSSDTRHFVVLTDKVLNRSGTGYRGVYRATPQCLLFAANNYERATSISEGLQEDEFLTFTDVETARIFLKRGRGYGIDSEIIECVMASDAVQPSILAQSQCFLGFDVAQPYGYSAIVDRCLDLWDPKARDEKLAALETARCVAEFFNAKLNQHRLFDSYEDALYFLRVDRECAEHFGGCSVCQPTVIAILSVE